MAKNLPQYLEGREEGRRGATGGTERRKEGRDGRKEGRDGRKEGKAKEGKKDGTN